MGNLAAISWKIPLRLKVRLASVGQTLWGICLESFSTPGKSHRQKNKTKHSYQHTLHRPSWICASTHRHAHTLLCVH